MISTKTAKPPPAPVAALLSPFLWITERPDRFDVYSAGLIFLQLAIPSLRTRRNVQQLQKGLRQYDNDLARFRESSAGSGYNWDQLDRDAKAGFDLASKLLCKRKAGRLSAQQALLHRYFLFS